ncbi:MAG: hypothetical protein NTX14_00340 [Candidatus Nealsonbacteria bacterium]|nr:hypothetical protein [Candidatus Nealsonbacteria bacterium]
MGNNSYYQNVSCKFVNWFELALPRLSEKEMTLIRDSFLSNWTSVSPAEKRKIVCLICDRAGSQWGQGDRFNISAAYGAFRLIFYSGNSVIRGDRSFD